MSYPDAYGPQEPTGYDPGPPGFRQVVPPGPADAPTLAAASGPRPSYEVPPAQDSPATSSRSAARAASTGSVHGQAISTARVGAIVGLAALGVGLVLPEGGKMVLFQLPTWSIFAVLCAGLVLQRILTVTLPSGPRVTEPGVLAAAGLFCFWVLLVLPSVGSNVGFLLTLATAATCGSAWLHFGKS